MNYMIDSLLKLADKLDSEGEVRAANEIDEIIKKMAEEPNFEEELKRLKEENASEPVANKPQPEDMVNGKEERVYEYFNDLIHMVDSALGEAEFNRVQLAHTPELENAIKSLHKLIGFIKSQSKLQREDVADDHMKSAMAKLSDISDTLDKAGAMKVADKIDAFIEKYSSLPLNVDWKGEGDTEQSKRYDAKHHHEQLVKEPKEMHKNGPEEHHIKEYDGDRKTLSTRYCPNHVGVMMHRVGEYTFQCPEDGQVFNWEEGFDNDKGQHIDGGSVAGQTPNSTGYFATPSRIFDHREDIINRIN